MKFDLVRPCKLCPFRTDCLKGWLGAPRVRETIASMMVHDKSFPCHETVEHDDEGDYVPTSTEQRCAGALIFLEKHDRPNQMMRIAERLRFYDRRKLDMDAPVFNTARQMIARHREGPRRRIRNANKRTPKKPSAR